MRAVLLLLALCLCAQVLAVPTIVSTVAANLQTMSQFEFSSVSPVNGVQAKIGNLTTVGGILPQTSAYIPGTGVIFLSLASNGAECVTAVNTKGVQQYHYCFHNYVLDNLAYDINTNQIFLNCYWSATSQNHVMQLNPTTGVLTDVVEVPGLVQVGISTYCPNGHIFFLTLELDDAKTGLVRVDAKNKKVLDSIEVVDAIEILMWDYTTGTMYSWVASEDYAGELVVLDITTGKRIKTIISFAMLSANGGSSTMDLKTKTVYASLINIAQGEQQPVWVVVDTVTGKVTTTNTNTGFPINLALIQ